MNANELTALIGECLRETDDHEFFLKLESVLRQQQAEIESLKKLVQLQYEDAIVQGHETEALKSEIAALQAEKERLFASMLDMALDSELNDLKYGKTQEPLGEKFEKVLHNNLWNLLEESNGKAQEK